MDGRLHLKEFLSSKRAWLLRRIPRRLLSSQKEIGCHQAVARRRTQRHLWALYHCAETPNLRTTESGWYEQAEDRKDDEALEHVKVMVGPALAAERWRSLGSVLPNLRSTEWEETKGLGRTKEQMPMCLLPRCAPSHSVRLRGARLWGCHRNGNNQCQSIQCWIVRDKRLQQCQR